MLEQHSINSAMAAFAASPMSRERAQAVAVAMAAAAEGHDLAAAPELALLVAVAAGEVALVIDAVELVEADYPALSEAQYMVSVYNGATVPRVLVQLPDGSRRRLDQLIARAHAQVIDLCGGE